MAYDVPFIKNNTGDGSFTFATLPSGAATSTIPKGVMAYTTDESMCVWTGTAWNPIGTSIGPVVFSSGDTTGAKDTTTIQNALNTARVPYSALVSTGPTANNSVVTLIPGIYYINAPLRIGSMTTLDARGATINLVSGTNTNMLNNYGATAVLTSVSGGGTGAAGNVISFVNGAADPIVIAVQAITTNTGATAPLWGATLTIPQAYTGNSFTNAAYNGTNGATYAANTLGVNSFHQCQMDTVTPANISTQTVNLYYRDVSIKILGGIWNMGSNGSGSHSYLDHCTRFMFVDGLTISGATFLSQGSNNLYAVAIIGCTNFDTGYLYFDVNPGSYPWTPNLVPGFARDGVHVIGPSRDGHIHDLYSSIIGDDLVSLTTFDWGNIAQGIGGSITNLNISNLYLGQGGSRLVVMAAGPGTTISGIRVNNVTAHGCQKLLYIGDDNRNSGGGNNATAGGTYDDIVCDKVSGLTNNTITQAVQIQGPGVGRVALKNLSLGQVAAASVNLIELGLGATGSAQTTTIKDLTIEGLEVSNLVGSNKVLHTQSSTTITQLRLKDWQTPLTNYPLIVNTGTITSAFSGDVLNIVSLTAQTAAITSTTAFTPGLTGMYRFIVDLVTTAAGTAGTVTGSIITNNGSGSTTQTTSTANLASLGSEISQVFTAYCASGQGINYSTTVVTSTGFQYSLQIRMEFMG